MKKLLIVGILSLASLNIMAAEKCYEIGRADIKFPSYFMKMCLKSNVDKLYDVSFAVRDGSYSPWKDMLTYKNVKKVNSTERASGNNWDAFAGTSYRILEHAPVKAITVTFDGVVGADSVEKGIVRINGTDYAYKAK